MPKDTWGRANARARYGPVGYARYSRPPVEGGSGPHGRFYLVDPGTRILVKPQRWGTCREHVTRKRLVFPEYAWHRRGRYGFRYGDWLLTVEEGKVVLLLR